MGDTRCQRVRIWWMAGLLVIAACAAAVLLCMSRRSLGPSDSAPDDSAAAALRQAVQGANVVILVLDAARADHVGCYGYGRPTTPNIDRLALESLVFTSHFCQVPFTTPSTASLFTGQFPDTHWNIYPAWEHPEPVFTMAKGFSDAGFRTTLFSSTPCASPAMGVGNDFAETYYRARDLTEGPGFSPEALLLHVEAWLSENAGRQFLAYLHFVPPHSPYEQPEEMTELFADREPPGFAPEKYTPWQFEFPIYENEKKPGLEIPPPLPEWINLYDANLRYADWVVGEVLNMLAASDLLDTTLLIVTSDHGEAFGEHGFIWHPHAIHDEVTHIPLIVRFPGDAARPRTIDCLTQTIDVLPTLCDLFEISIPREHVQGQSLVSVMTGAAESAAEYTVIKSFRPQKYMVRDERYALLLYRNPEWRALYDLRSDPGQRGNVIDTAPDHAERLLGYFREYAEDQWRPPEAFLSAEMLSVPESQPGFSNLPEDVRRELEALGYLD